MNINTSYNFKGLKVAFFNNKYLNTTSQTVVKVLDIDIQLSEEITAAAEEMKPTQKVHEYGFVNFVLFTRDRTLTNETQLKCTFFWKTATMEMIRSIRLFQSTLNPTTSGTPDDRLLSNAFKRCFKLSEYF